LGQKVNPIGLRLGITRSSFSTWYSDDKFADYLVEDEQIRKYLNKRIEHAGISSILIANNDNYTDVCMGPINSNVLDNDIGLSSNINVTLIESPKYADTFTLNSDGSFNYKSIMMPSESLNQDSFKYQVLSGGQTAIGTVFFTMNTGGQCSEVVLPPEPLILPYISSVTPTTVILNQSTVFTVNGSALPSTLAMWIDNCENIVSLGGDSTHMQFSCTPSWYIGSQNGIVKDKSGGNVLNTFSVTFENPPFALSQLNYSLWNTGNWYYYFTTNGNYTSYHYGNSCYSKTTGYQFVKVGDNYDLSYNGSLYGSLASMELQGNQWIITNINNGNSLSFYKSNLSLSTLENNLCTE